MIACSCADALGTQGLRLAWRSIVLVSACASKCESLGHFCEGQECVELRRLAATSFDAWCVMGRGMVRSHLATSMRVAPTAPVHWTSVPPPFGRRYHIRATHCSMSVGNDGSRPHAPRSHGPALGVDMVSPPSYRGRPWTLMLEVKCTELAGRLPSHAGGGWHQACPHIAWLPEACQHRLRHGSLRA